MNDRLRNERGRYSTAEGTSDHEKGILNPEITGQTLAQHSEKGLLTPENTAQHEKGFLSSLSTGTADTQMTVTAAITLASYEKSEVAIFLEGLFLQGILTEQHVRFLLDIYPCETREDLSLVSPRGNTQGAQNTFFGPVALLSSLAKLLLGGKVLV